ncbi:hypothetical protein NMY22_g14231 [Coprinellus aureogranulatus]|nr:hypothetical protein NMY22_g14231 [Coprinellus aureogranulatus]
MEPTLKRPPLFDRRIDRQQYDRLQWDALELWLNEQSPGPDLLQGPLPILGGPVQLSDYGYDTAHHWLCDPQDNNSAIALFDVPARINFCTLEGNFGDPYFDLPRHRIHWDEQRIRDARLIVTCDILTLDNYAPHPPVAKDQSRRMMQMLKATFEANEKRYDDYEAEPFWGTFSNGQNYFVFESAPVFEPEEALVARGDIVFADRLPSALTDGEEKYRGELMAGLILNPPAIYDSMHNLIHPNEYVTEIQHGDVVMARTALCMVRNGNCRLYKHRLMELHRMPSSLPRD